MTNISSIINTAVESQAPCGAVPFCFQELQRFLSGEAAFGCRTAKDQFKPWIPERSPEHIQYWGYKIHILLFSINLFAYQLSYQWLSHLSISLIKAILFSNQMASSHKCIKQADVSIQSMHNTTNTHKHAHPRSRPSIIYHHLSYAGDNMWFQHALSGGRLQGQDRSPIHPIYTALIYRDKHTLTFTPACYLQIKLTCMVGVGGSQKEPIQAQRKQSNPTQQEPPHLPTPPPCTHTSRMWMPKSPQKWLPASALAKQQKVL